MKHRGEVERHRHRAAGMTFVVSQPYEVTVDEGGSSTTYMGHVSLTLIRGDLPVTVQTFDIPRLRELRRTIDVALELLGERPTSDTVLDSDMVDRIALGLGTQEHWGSDELEWIANAIGRVRPHPGHDDPAEYVGDFWDATGTDPEHDPRLFEYLSGEYQDELGGRD